MTGIVVAHPLLVGGYAGARNGERRRPGQGRRRPGGAGGGYVAVARVPRYSSMTLGSFISDRPVSV